MRIQSVNEGFGMEGLTSPDWVSCIRSSPNTVQLTIVSASWDRTVKVWNLTNCKLKCTLSGHACRLCEYHRGFAERFHVRYRWQKWCDSAMGGRGRGFTVLMLVLPFMLCALAPQDKPCEICGADGYAELLATCIKCNITNEHVYCMLKVRKEGPQDWVCESCSPPESARKEEALVSPDVVLNDGEQLSAPSKVHYTSSLQAHSKRLKHADTSKVKFIPAEEVIRLSLGGTTKTTFSPKRGFSNFKAPMSRRTPIKSKILTPISPVKKPPKFGSMQLISRIEQHRSQNLKRNKRNKGSCLCKRIWI